MKKETSIMNLKTISLCALLLMAISCDNKIQEKPGNNQPVQTTQPAELNNDNLCNPCNGACVSLHCLLAPSCAESACLDEIKAAHELTAVQYNNAITDYYTYYPGPLGLGFAPEPLIMLRAQVESLINKPCSLYRIKYDLNEVDLGTHEYMHFYALRGHTRPVGETNSYSISFFRALLRDASITEFRFSRGMSCVDGNQPTMMVATARGPAPMAPIYFADLTDVIPVFHPVPTAANKQKS